LNKQNANSKQAKTLKFNFETLQNLKENNFNFQQTIYLKESGYAPACGPLQAMLGDTNPTN
jgi:hypothetical protein